MLQIYLQWKLFDQVIFNYLKGFPFKEQHCFYLYNVPVLYASSSVHPLRVGPY